MISTNRPSSGSAPWRKLPETIRRALTGLLILALAASTLAGCAEAKKKTDLKDLETGIAVVAYLLRHDILLISSFPQLYPRTRPGDFIQWMFSPASKNDWPVTEAMIEANPNLEDWQGIPGYPVLPKSIHLVPEKPDPRYQKQVVVKTGDGPDRILVEAYLTPDAPPVLQRELILPELKI